MNFNVMHNGKGVVNPLEATFIYEFKTGTNWSCKNFVLFSPSMSSAKDIFISYAVYTSTDY